jgi:hypothetical protein
MVSELHNLSERWFQAWLEKDAATVEGRRARLGGCAPPHKKENGSTHTDCPDPARRFLLPPGSRVSGSVQPRAESNRRLALQFRCAEFSGRWIRCQRPLPVSLGELMRSA